MCFVVGESVVRFSLAALKVIYHREPKRNQVNIPELGFSNGNVMNVMTLAQVLGGDFFSF